MCIYIYIYIHICIYIYRDPLGCVHQRLSIWKGSPLAGMSSIPPATADRSEGLSYTRVMHVTPHTMLVYI